MQGTLKIACVSDTHSTFTPIEEIIKEGVKGDIFIHAGDFTRYSKEKHFEHMIDCLSRLQFRHKIVIAGNHELVLDKLMSVEKRRKYVEKKYFQETSTREDILCRLKKHCIYLEHQAIEIQGITIFASPHTLCYGNSAFQYEEKHDEAIWSAIPEHLDILVTHGPPLGILDTTAKGKSGGSAALLKRVMQVKPKYHIFGHIHEGQGKEVRDGIIFLNVAKKVTFFEWGNEV